jgi:Rrf2 family nitric oxide-sensitive transcriptional repressor
MRLTTRTNLAMRTLMFCAVNRDHLVRKADVAEHCNASENHLALVIHMLAQAGFIETTRGRHGGIRLSQDPEEIVVGNVFRHFEADVPFAECFDREGNACPITPCCRLRDALLAALDAFYASLDAVRLSDLTAGNCALEELLRIEGNLRPGGCAAASEPVEQNA